MLRGIPPRCEEVDNSCHGTGRAKVWSSFNFRLNFNFILIKEHISTASLAVSSPKQKVEKFWKYALRLAWSETLSPIVFQAHISAAVGGRSCAQSYPTVS